MSDSDIILKVTALVDEAAAELKKLPGALEETEAATKKASFSFTELNSAVQLGKQAVQLLGDVYRATIAPTLDAASAQRELALAGQITAEQAGVLIQVGDDLKISSDTLKTAFREMTKDGLQPTLANIKEVAAKYQSTQDPTERLQYAQDALGRSYQSMLPFLEQTPEALDAMAESAYRAGTVMSNEAVQAARDYEIAVDDLTDSVHGFVYAASNDAIPILTQLVDGLNNNVIANDYVAQALAAGIITSTEAYNTYVALRQGVMDATVVIETLGPKVDALTAAHRAETDAALATSDAISRHEAALVKEGAALDPLPPKVNTLAAAFGNLSLALSGPLKTEEENFEAKQATIQAQIDASKAKIGELIGQGYSPMGATIGAVSATLTGQETALETNATKHEEATRRIVFGLAQQKLQADITSGAIGPEMAAQVTAMLNQVGVDWGILDEETVAATTIIDDAVSALTKPGGSVDDFEKTLLRLGDATAGEFGQGAVAMQTSANDIDDTLATGVILRAKELNTELGVEIPEQAILAGEAMGELGDQWEDEYSAGGNLNLMRIETQGLAYDIWSAAEQIRNFPAWPPPTTGGASTLPPPEDRSAQEGGSRSVVQGGATNQNVFNINVANDVDAELVAYRVVAILAAA